MNTFGTKGSYRIDGLDEETLQTYGFRPTDEAKFCLGYIGRKETSPIFWAPRKKKFYTLESDYRVSSVYCWRRYWEFCGGVYGSYNPTDLLLDAYTKHKMI